MNKKIGLFISLGLVFLCFAMWGCAGSLTNPMVKAFSKIFQMSTTDGILVQVAYSAGYFVMALPAALFIRRYTYKSGMVLGLFLFATGAFLFFPAAAMGDYYPFLFAYFVLTCGLSFLETSANPYILTMGDSRQGVLRLNIAQSFNPVGCLLGIVAAKMFIMERISPLSVDERATLTADEFEAVKMSDLTILSTPYLWLGFVVLAMAVLLFALPLQTSEQREKREPLKFFETLKRLLSAPGYKSGFFAQFFYVGAQVMCWTFIVQYGTNLFTGQGLSEMEAESKSLNYHMWAMVLFCVFRFICTALMKVINASKLLAFFSLAAIVLTGVVIFSDTMLGLYSLVGVSACMSLMFPTIYGLSLRGLDAEDAKIGAVGQVMAIVGGSALPPLQAIIIDTGDFGTMAGVNASFIVPAMCFMVVMFFAIQARMKEKETLIDIIGV